MMMPSIPSIHLETHNLLLLALVIFSPFFPLLLLIAFTRRFSDLTLGLFICGYPPQKRERNSNHFFNAS